MNRFLSTRIGFQAKNYKKGGSLSRARGTNQFFYFRLFAEHFDGLTNDWLIELGLGINGVSPETDSHYSQTAQQEICTTLERPM